MNTVLTQEEEIQLKNFWFKIIVEMYVWGRVGNKQH